MKTIAIPSALLILILIASVQPLKAQMRTENTPEVITAFAATPNGKLLALGSKSILKVYDFETGGIVINSTDLSSSVRALTLSRDGMLLVFAFDNSSRSNNLNYWDLNTMLRYPITHTHKDRIICLAISADGKLIASGSKDNTIKLFETKNFKELATLTGHKDDVTCLRFSPNNKFLLSGSKDKSVILWDLSNNTKLSTLISHSQKVNAVAFSPDSELFASASDDKTIKVWNLYDLNQPAYTLEGHSGGVTSVEFTPEGNFLGTASRDKTFIVWDYKKESAINLNLGKGTSHNESINFLAFGDKGKLYTCSSDLTIKFWNWGFPILSMSFQLDDANRNGRIEGSEKVTLRASIDNTGEGPARMLKFTMIESSRIAGITYPSSFSIDEIAPKSRYEVEIPLTVTSQVINSTAKFRFGDFTMISNPVFSLHDTVVSIETVATPLLQIDSIRFVDSDSNRILTGRERGVFQIYTSNNGVGKAYDVRLRVFCDDPGSELEFNEEITCGDIGILTPKLIMVPVKANSKLTDKLVNIKFEISDKSKISVATITTPLILKKYNPTILEEIQEIVEMRINDWQKKDDLEKLESYKQRVTESTRSKQIELYYKQAIDSIVKREFQWSKAENEYDSENEVFMISIPKFEPILIKVPYSEARSFRNNFTNLKVDSMQYTINDKNRIAFLHIEFCDTLNQNRPKYIFNSKDLIAFSSTSINYNFEQVDLQLPVANQTHAITKETRSITVGKSDVDIKIPEIRITNENVFAVVIGNEDYSMNQNDLSPESDVMFAKNDALAFSNYLRSTFGIPEKNIRCQYNATLVNMRNLVIWLQNLAETKKGEAELIFYFSGHGLPDQITHEGYIMPVDVRGNDIQSAINLNDLYLELSKFPTKKVTVFLDACFSGGGREKGLLALKQAVIESENKRPTGNMVVFTSSSGYESSGFYKEKQHGMFTYFLLKKFQETNGDVDYQSLIDYLKQEVNKGSLLNNNMPQNPQIITSNELTQPLNSFRIGTASPVIE